MLRLCVILVLAASAWAARATIEMKDEAVVAPGRILLGDLAEIEGEVKLVSELRALPVGRVDMPGRETRISIHAIRSFYLKAICSLDSLEMEKKGFVKVRARSQEIEKDSLEFLLLHALIPLTKGMHGKDWKLDVSRIPEKIQVPDQDFVWKMDISPRYDGCGTDMATLRVQVAGKDKMKVAIPFTVRRWANVVRTANPIQRGQKIKTSDILVEWLEVTNQQRRMVGKLDDALGRIALRSIARDQDLQESWLERPWTVREGEEIRMNVEIGQSLVSVVGIARQNGYQGQRIEVENPETGKRMQAEVDAPGEVRILN